MCLAIYSPKGNPIPKDEYLERAFAVNPDGAGYAYNYGGQVRIKKGFMTYEKFIDAFHEDAKRYDFKRSAVLIHFRIATHGGVNPGDTHPFPISAKEKRLTATDLTADFAVIHNGIISLTSEEAIKNKTLSDTQVFIRRYLTKIASNPNWFHNEYNRELIEDLIESKMAILNGQGEILATSGFTKDADGNFYSNSSYKKSAYYTFPRFSYRWSDYEDTLLPTAKKKSDKSSLEEYWEQLKAAAEMEGYEPEDLEEWRKSGFTVDEIEDFVFGDCYNSIYQ